MSWLSIPWFKREERQGPDWVPKWVPKNETKLEFYRDFRREERQRQGPDWVPENELELEFYRDRHRYKLANQLLRLLIIQVTAFLLFYFIAPLLGLSSEITDNFSSAIPIIFGPTSALVGSAAGFYFRTRNYRTPEHEVEQKAGKKEQKGSPEQS